MRIVLWAWAWSWSFLSISKYILAQRKWSNCTISDVWSAGCVVAELLLGQPIFPGDSGVDQLVEIIKVESTSSTAYWKNWDLLNFSVAARSEFNVILNLFLFRIFRKIYIIIRFSGFRYSNTRTNPRDESQLHGIQVSPDQEPSMGEGEITDPKHYTLHNMVVVF